MSTRKRVTVKIDVTDSCGTGRPVDCAALAKVLIRRAREAPAQAAILTALSDAIASGTGVVSVPVTGTAEQLDAVRSALLAAAQTETDGRRRASDLVHVRRSWEAATGFGDRAMTTAGRYPGYRGRP